MSSEELQRVENRLADEKKRMEKLEEGFEARKAEHERRAQIAAEREKVRNIHFFVSDQVM